MAAIAPVFAAVGSAFAASGSFVSTAATVLSAASTVGSVIMGMQQAKYEQQAGHAQAREAMVNAQISGLEGQQEVVASEARAVEIRRETMRKVAAARGAFAASGIDISSDQLAAVESSIEGDSAYQLGIERANRERVVAEAGIRSGQYRARADNALVAGAHRAGAARMGAFTTGASGLLSIIKRG